MGCINSKAKVPNQKVKWPDPEKNHTQSAAASKYSLDGDGDTPGNYSESGPEISEENGEGGMTNIGDFEVSYDKKSGQLGNFNNGGKKKKRRGRPSYGEDGIADVDLRSYSSHLKSSANSRSTASSGTKRLGLVSGGSELTGLPGLELSEHKRSQSERNYGGFIGGSFGMNNGLMKDEASPSIATSSQSGNWDQNGSLRSFGSREILNSSSPSSSHIRNFANVDRRGDDDGFDDDW